MGDETPDGVPDELADFWQVARVRAGLGKVAAVTGPGVTATMVPPTWSFGDGPELADRLLALVLDGVKTATAGAEVEYAQSGEPLPVKGDVSIVVDSAGHPGALIRTTRVDVVPFDAVDEVMRTRRARTTGPLPHGAPSTSGTGDAPSDRLRPGPARGARAVRAALPEGLGPLRSPGGVGSAGPVWDARRPSRRVGRQLGLGHAADQARGDRG